MISFLPLARMLEAGLEPPPNCRFTYCADYREEAILAACQGKRMALCISQSRITARVVRECPTLRFVQTVGAGYDMVDVAACSKAGVLVANAPGQNATSVAEMVMGLVIALQRQVLTADREVKAGRFAPERERLWGAGVPEVRGSVLGTVGLGAIGREVARLARAMGAEVLYFARRRHPDAESALGVSYLSLPDLLRAVDVLVLNVPLDESTCGLIGAAELAMLKPSAILVNTARGAVVDERALARAIAEGRIAGAALDTFSREPLPADSPLLQLPPPARDRLILTPHIAGLTGPALRRMLAVALENLARVAAGQPPLHVVNGGTGAPG